MSKSDFIRTLNADNIERAISEYAENVEDFGKSFDGKSGRDFLKAVKRDACGIGPYPDVSLFEAANRIMTDLLLLDGVKWLLLHGPFPFSEYQIQYGHESSTLFDIEAKTEHKSLVGESFNVSRSFYQPKKTMMLKKLRTHPEAQNADYRIIIVNADAVETSYMPKFGPGEFFLFVDVGNDHAKLIPSIEPTGASENQRLNVRFSPH